MNSGATLWNNTMYEQWSNPLEQHHVCHQQENTEKHLSSLDNSDFKKSQ
jgi:hypothetical protein